MSTLLSDQNNTVPCKYLQIFFIAASRKPDLEQSCNTAIILICSMRSCVRNVLSTYDLHILKYSIRPAAQHFSAQDAHMHGPASMTGWIGAYAHHHRLHLRVSHLHAF